MIRRPPRSTLFPTRRSSDLSPPKRRSHKEWLTTTTRTRCRSSSSEMLLPIIGDRKSTRLNSSHGYISYAVFCLKKKKSNNCTDGHRCYMPLQAREACDERHS